MEEIKIIKVKVAGICSKCRKEGDSIPRDSGGKEYRDLELSCPKCEKKTMKNEKKTIRMRELGSMVSCAGDGGSRFWDKELKRICNLDGFRMRKNGIIHLFIEGQSEFQIENIENIELIQPTGLKDSNGKEIFEGDILEEEVKDKDGNAMKQSGTGKTWKNIFLVNFGMYDNGCYECEGGTMGFYLKDIMTLWSDGKREIQDGCGGMYDCEKKKIIGNIYENPELMEVKNERNKI